MMKDRGVTAAIAGAGFGSGGKSEHDRTRWWVTPTGRKARESATENTPPKAGGNVGPVRVKRCGKSAPPGG